MRKLLSIVLVVVLVIALSSCNKKDELIIVTTTSLDNSGLLAYILPDFEKECNCKVKVVALGTGAALEIGKEGEADILLVHDLIRELKFIEDGFGIERKTIMYNDFIFIGPEKIEVSPIKNVLAFLASGNDFYSRGDLSGTHSKELRLWDSFGYDVNTFGDWYHETGQGMGSTISMANIQQFYTFTDRGTYLSMIDDIDLKIAYENTEELINLYGVIKVNDQLHNRDTKNADLFYTWITKAKTQDLIDSYVKYGEQLFYSYKEE